MAGTGRQVAAFYYKIPHHEIIMKVVIPDCVVKHEMENCVIYSYTILGPRYIKLLLLLSLEKGNHFPRHYYLRSYVFLPTFEKGQLIISLNHLFQMRRMIYYCTSIHMLFQMRHSFFRCYS